MLIAFFCVGAVGSEKWAIATAIEKTEGSTPIMTLGVSLDLKTALSNQRQRRYSLTVTEKTAAP
jgi:hypothetical protein